MQQKTRTDSKLPEILRGCRRGREASQIALYRHFYAYGLSICLRYSASQESAKEILNDAFLKVFLKIEQYDNHFEFKPWLRKILINTAVDHHRKYYAKLKEESAPLNDLENSTYNEALDELEYQDLIQLMQELSPAYRLVFNLYVIEGLNHQEIATKLGVSVGTSKSNLAKARQKIRILLNKTWGVFPISKR